MRFLLFFGIICFLQNKCNSQGLNFASHSNVDNVFGLASINGKNFYTERIVNNSNFDSSNLVGLNESGKIIFKKRLTFNDFNTPQNIHSTRGKRLILYGVSSRCNAGETAANFIVKADTNGVIQATTTSQTMVNGSLAKFIDFVEYPDSSFYFLSESQLFHYSKTLTFVSSVAHGLAFATTMTLRNNGNFVIHGKTSALVAKNIEISSTGTQVNSQNAASDLSLIRTAASGNFYGLTTNGNIQKLSSGLLTTGNSSLSLSPTNIRAFTLRNDTIFFVDLNNTNNPAYGVMNENFTIFSVSASSYRNIFPNAITINNRNKINILSTATSSMSPNNTFVSFFQFQRNSNFFTTPDIGVSNFTITNTLLYPPFSSSIPVNINVMVKNYGTDTIKGFCLNAPGTQKTCGFDLFHKKYQNIIPPNGSVVVQTGTINYPLTSTVTQASGFLFVTNICIFTTVPSSKNDIHIDNDHFCQAIGLRVGIEENKSDANWLTVAPNPISGEFSIRSYSEMKSLQIYDCFGKLVGEKVLKMDEVKIDISELESGIYLLKIETEKSLIFKKVFKE
jgi:hypothetical protein